ncbi:hypothetical protein BG006_001328 [Podila minutissima]|uniref:Uncharacterized protein n=1 Tax=Podila minutissima TaxID=64525 RepID=A0A9P5VHA5_9FUNG|nr:hypothetical protein BG006_001328 [Podila minutissima]
MSSQQSHRTPEPFTDPEQGGDSAIQSAAKTVALPLAAAGGAISEVATKVKEFVTGHSTKIDTSHSCHERSSSSIASSSQGSTNT